MRFLFLFVPIMFYSQSCFSEEKCNTLDCLNTDLSSTSIVIGSALNSGVDNRPQTDQQRNEAVKAAVDKELSIIEERRVLFLLCSSIFEKQAFDVCLEAAQDGKLGAYKFIVTMSAYKTNTIFSKINSNIVSAEDVRKVLDAHIATIVANEANRKKISNNIIDKAKNKYVKRIPIVVFGVAVGSLIYDFGSSVIEDDDSVITSMPPPKDPT